MFVSFHSMDYLDGVSMRVCVTFPMTITLDIISDVLWSSFRDESVCHSVRVDE